ncbi:MAG TPA: hypothetical protein PLG56_01585 [Lacunisphaera sp.]|jgi:hypothetical protein|nr:hypothetical protein [Lacunisphaera sp.]
MKIFAIVLACVVAAGIIALVFYKPLVGVIAFVVLAIIVAFSKRSFRQGIGSLLKDLLTGW